LVHFHFTILMLVKLDDWKSWSGTKVAQRIIDRLFDWLLLAGRTSVGSTRGFNGQGRDTIHFGCQHPEAHSKFSASMTLPTFLLPLSSLSICQSGCNFPSVSVFDDFNQLLPSFFQFSGSQIDWNGIHSTVLLCNLHKLEWKPFCFWNRPSGAQHHKCQNSPLLAGLFYPWGWNHVIMYLLVGMLH
jgi:hypothetical protein